MSESAWLEAKVTETIEKFGATVAAMGRRYFSEGKVKSLRESNRDGVYEAEVLDEKKKSYKVELAFARGRDSNLLCDCPIGTECKHAYAALLFLAQRFRKKAVVEESEQKEAGSQKNLQKKGFFRFVADPSQLSELEVDNVERLEELYEIHQENRQINGRILRGIFAKWPEKDHWEEIAIAPRVKLSRLQFWHFLVVNLESRRLEVPGYFGKYNDVSESKDLIRDWQEELTAQDWIKQYEEVDGTNIGELDSELRWKLVDAQILLEIKTPDGKHFYPIQPAQLNQLLSDWRTGRVEVPVELMILLTQHALADSFQSPCRFQINPIFAKRLNALLREAEIRKYFCDENGDSLEYGIAEWRIEEKERLVVKLVHEGRAIDSTVLHLSGVKHLYLFGNKLLEGPPPPFPTEGIYCPTRAEIPRVAVGSIAGIRWLIDGGHSLPGSLEKRVTRVALKPRVTVEIDEETIWLQAGFFDPRNHRTVVELEPTRSNEQTRTILKEGEQFVIQEFDRGLADALRLALNRLAHDYASVSRQWRMRETKNPERMVQKLAKWIRDLPPGIDYVLPEGLMGLGMAATEVDLEFKYDDAGNDWFDLKVLWNDSDLALTPEEIQLLLAAHGEPVELPGRDYRTAQIRIEEKLRETLEELGIDLSHLVTAPERLHLTHLGALLEAGLVPQHLRKQFEDRLSKIASVVSPKVPKTIQATLRPYQLAGFHFLAYLTTNQFGGILADDMGLGKTLQTLSWLAWLQSKKALTGPCLVVCPKSVVDNWLSEAGRFYPSISIEAVGRSGWSRDLLRPGKVLVLNYAQLRLLKEELTEPEWCAIIFDEGQYLKNAGSQTAQVARSLKGKNKIMLTGTPIENRLLDLWSLMHCVMPGALGIESRFKKNFQEKSGPEVRKRLARRVRPFILRRTKEEVALELPDKVEEDIRVTMEEFQETLYNSELKFARQRLLNIQTDEELSQQRFHLLTSLLRLRQICCDPALVNPETESPGAKLEALMDLLEPLIEEGNKILVFSQFTKMLELIEQRAEAAKWTTFKLTGESQNRGKIVENFNQSPDGAVFLISLRAGGSGLNLMAASYVVLFDPWWNPAVENQAIDRAHRIGQTKTVFAYRLLVQDTIEDKIRKLQLRKSKLAQDVFGEEAFGQALTLDDFKYLLGEG